MAVALQGIEYVKDRLNNGRLFDDYEELKIKLYEENLELKNSSYSTNHDITDKSYRAATRSDNERRGLTKTFKKSTYYGVIVGKLDNGIWSDKTFYVDVPLWNKKLIDHPDTFQNSYIKDDNKLKQFEDLIFIDKTGFLTFLDVNDLVEVNLPENYPNHIPTNKADCFIINSFGKAVNGRKDVAKNKGTGGGGAFDAANAASSGGGVVTGGTVSNLPSWAVTNTNSGLDAYKQSELKQINDVSKSLSVINQRIDQYKPKIAVVCQHFNVDPRYIYAIASAETKFQHELTSRTGAGGLMQLTIPAITDSITRGNIQDIEAVKKIIGNIELLQKNRAGKKIATPALVNLAKTNLDLNIWIGVNTWIYSRGSVDGSGRPIVLKAAAAYNGGIIKSSYGDNSGVKSFNFNNIRKESQDYIFKFNAYLNLLPASQGANIS